MRVLAVVLLLAAVGAACVSWSGRHAMRVEPFMYTSIEPGTRDVTPAGRDLFDETLDARGFDAYGAMRADDSRLWLGVAIALLVAAVALAVAVIAGHSRIVAVGLVGLAAVALVVSVANHDRLRIRTMGWTTYAPVETNRIDAEFRRRVTAYSAMPADDARLSLGLSIGFAVSAVGAGVVAVRQRQR